MKTSYEAIQLVLAQGGQLTTVNLRDWITNNIVPLILLAIAVILLWIGGRGDNAGVARRSIGLLVGLIALGIAVTGSGPAIGQALANLLVTQADPCSFARTTRSTASTPSGSGRRVPRFPGAPATSATAWVSSS